MFDGTVYQLEHDYYRIQKVFSDGSALATVDDMFNYGQTVYLLAGEDAEYKVHETVKVPFLNDAVQVGIYKYEEHGEMKEVPVVRLGNTDFKSSEVPPPATLPS